MRSCLAPRFCSSTWSAAASADVMTGTSLSPPRHFSCETHPWPFPLPLRLPFWEDWKPAGNTGVPANKKGFYMSLSLLRTYHVSWVRLRGGADCMHPMGVGVHQDSMMDLL